MLLRPSKNSIHEIIKLSVCFFKTCLIIYFQEPVFNGYQLIGDSQFLRFAERVLHLKRKENKGLSCLGLCVSGQKISDLMYRVKWDFAGVSEKVVVMIGTNDLLRGTSFEVMRTNLELLLNMLTIEAKKVILLTVPPVPKLKEDKDHWDRLKKYNEYIKELEDNVKIFVADAYSEFIVSKVSPKRKLSTSSPHSTKRRNRMEPTPSKLHSMKCSNSMEPTPSPLISTKRRCSMELMRTHNRKRLSSSAFDVLFRLGIPFNSSEETFLASKPRRSLPLLSQNSVDTTVQKKPRRRSLFFDSESNDTDCQPPAVKRRKRTVFPFDRYTARVLGEVMTGPLTSSPGVNDSFMTPSKKIPSRRTPIVKKRRVSYSEADVEQNDSFCQETSEDLSTTLSRNMLVLKKKRYSCSKADVEHNNSFGQEVAEDSFMTSSRKTPTRTILVVKKQRNSYLTANDEQNDSFGREPSEDKVEIETAPKIREEFFEKYYSSDCRRLDQIHLNEKGLRIIGRIIQNTIDSTDR
ncbi:hypothetical protein V9T40_003930 [Parthenolecanium corni]|uniref:OSK domain-containing protein n=1 Tax=Parthenolecanium corni TaxID=536013 RepID=A0AAN9Y372_9HEMI